MQGEGLIRRIYGKGVAPAGEVSFRLHFELEAGRLRVGWECLKEIGLEIVTIEFPQLISVYERDPSGRLALTARGGRLVDPAACACSVCQHRYNWILDSFCGRS